jgi:hypothetical protein
LRDKETLTLTVGAASFPISGVARVQKVQAKDEHPSYVFGQSEGGVGQVKLLMKDR